MSSPSSARLSTAQRRSQILGVAREEFLTQGYAGARIQAVADAAGVTSALIYKHFESKEVLFEDAVMAPLHDLLVQRIEDVRTLPTDPDGTAQHESTRMFMRVLLRMFVESVEALGVILFGEHQRAQRFYGSHIRPLIDACIEASRANFTRWPHRDFDLETAVQAAFGMAFWLAMDRSLRMTERGSALTGAELRTLDQRADWLADLLFRGIGSH
jgi:AcrR family transcriptional regulator